MRTRTPYLYEIGTRLEEFEKAFNDALECGKQIKDKMSEILSPLEPMSSPQDIPPTLRKRVNLVIDDLRKLNDRILEERREFVKEEAIVSEFKDLFLVVLVGRVKQGKTTLCECLATVFERGLKRHVERFRLDEPTKEVPIKEALGKEIYAAYLHDKISDMLQGERKRDVLELWEKLKSKRFVLDEETADMLCNLDIQTVHLAVEGSYIKRRIESFEKGVLEIPKMQGFTAGKLCVLDAPGLASGNEFSRQRAVELWLASDMAVYLTSGDIPLERTDLDLLKEHASEKKRSIIFLISKCDHYSQDEDDQGNIVSIRYFDKDVFEKQKAWVRKILEEKGLAELLLESEVLGVSSKLFEEGMRGRSGRMAVENAIIEGHFDGFLKRLLEALKSEGVHRKSSAPKERAKKIAKDLVKSLDEMLNEIERGRKKDIPELERKASDAVSMFKQCALERLCAKLDERLVHAQNRVTKDTEVAVRLAKEEILAVLKECGDRIRDTLVAEKFDAIETIEISSLGKVLREFWEERLRTVRQKAGRSHVGSTAGGIAGALVGALVGGPFGVVLGGFLGSLWGSLFDEDEYVIVRRKYYVKVGDNFDDVREKMIKDIEATVDKAATRLEQEVQTAIGLYENWLKHLSNGILTRRDMVITNILDEEGACLAS